MPVLNWIGKEAVVNHDKDVPFRLLKKVKSASVGDNSQNLIIHGDNLEALKALMPYYYGKIKCIYIDPPYNTGNEGWVYNDKVNSPKIKKWLGKVVGGENGDLCRHDKWLCMMYPRLKLLKELLCEEGVIFVSIDDNEQSNLKVLMDELFGEENFLAQMIWRKRPNPPNDSRFIGRVHEYILLYRKSEKLENFRKVTRIDNSQYRNPDKDPRGDWKSTPLVLTGTQVRKTMVYKVVSPTGKEFLREYGWRVSKELFEKLNKDGRIYWGKDGNSMPTRKRYLSEDMGMTPTTIILEQGNTISARKEVIEMFGKLLFETPKPVQMLKQFIQMSTNPDDIILDSFAGSGTTGQAVLDLNKEDGGKRSFILIEMEDRVAKDITVERVKRAIKTYNYDDGFEYCELDKPLFNEEGQIEEECSFDQLATYIYFTETQTNIDKKKIASQFIGDYNEVSYYLLFKERGKNILNKSFLTKLKGDKQKKIIYADKCLIDDKTLEKYNIQFKQIPYEVKIY